MKISVGLIIMMVSLSAFAQDSLIWNTLYWRDDNGCFVTGDPDRPTALSSNSSWTAYMGDGYYPYTKIGNEMVRLPECNLAVFEGTTPGSLFAMSRWQAFYSPKKSKERKWVKLVERTNEFPLIATRFVFDKTEEIVGWVGFKDVLGYGTNYLMIYNLKNKSISDMIPVGRGFEGTSAIALTPGKKEFVVAAIDITKWCAAVKSYDYAGNVTNDYPTINSWFKNNKLCLGYNNGWNWNINLAYDQSSDKYLFYFSKEDEFEPHPKKAKEYKLDLKNDRVIEE